jgi:DNA-binding winged helix-turn-helix (wHTH) protein
VTGPSRFRTFGPFVVDTMRRMLWHDGVPVVITPRAFELLAALVERPGELLGKDELMRRVWAETIVEENNLARQVCTLRKVLQERPDHHDYILTVAGVGYQFVAEVRDADGPPIPATPAEPVRVEPSAPVPLAVPIPASAADASGRGWVRISRRTLALAAAGLVLTVAAGAIWVLRSGRTPPPAHRSLRQFTFGAAVQSDPAWSPTGDRIAFVSDRSGSRNIWVQGLDDPQPIPVTTSASHDSEPAWSPDGKWLAFRSDRNGGGLFVVSMSTGDVQQITDFGVRPRWSPTGRHVMFFDAEPDSAGAIRVYVVDAAGGAPRLFRDDVLARLNPISAGWHPTGGVSVWGRDANGSPVFVTMPLDGSGPITSHIASGVTTNLNADNVALFNFTWSPSSRYLYFEGQSRSVRNVWRITVDPKTLDWIDGPERLTTGPGTDEGLVV